MHYFEIPASNSDIKAVDIMIDGKEYPLSRDATKRGMWSGEVEQAKVGTDYKVRLNSDPDRTYPDPRSLYQPLGPSGPSRIVDLKFDWTNPDFTMKPVAQGLSEEMHIGTFTEEGTFDSAIEKLPYLAKLGVTMINLMPANECSGDRNWGYDGVNLYAAYSAYGGPKAFQRFVNACHENGIGVVLDVVYNHLGPEGNTLPCFMPFNNKANTPWGGAVNFDDAGSDLVRDYVADNAVMWARDFKVDGLRIDAADWLLDRSAKHILQEISDKLDGLATLTGKPIFRSAEFDQNEPRMTLPVAQNGMGMDAQWCDNKHHALLTAASRDRSSYYVDFGSMEMAAKSLRQGIVYDGQYSEFRQHKHGAPYGDASPDRFITFWCNHDQIGNRPQGDRPHERIGRKLDMVLSGLTLLAPQVPMLSLGSESQPDTPFQFFCDRQEPANAEAVTNGRKNDFKSWGVDPKDVPDPQDIATFNRSKLNWQELGQTEHRDALAWNKSLIDLRQSDPIFGRRDRPTTNFSEEGRWVTMNHSGLTVVANMSDQPQDIPLPAAVKTPSVILASVVGYELGKDVIRVPGQSLTVLGAESVKDRLPIDFPSEFAPGRAKGPNAVDELIRLAGVKPAPSSEAPAA